MKHNKTNSPKTTTQLKKQNISKRSFHVLLPRAKLGLSPL